MAARRCWSIFSASRSSKTCARCLICTPDPLLGPTLGFCAKDVDSVVAVDGRSDDLEFAVFGVEVRGIEDAVSGLVCSAVVGDSKR
jgi:hypothetical protein